MSILDIKDSGADGINGLFGNTSANSLAYVAQFVNIHHTSQVYTDRKCEYIGIACVYIVQVRITDYRMP